MSGELDIQHNCRSGVSDIRSAMSPIEAYVEARISARTRWLWALLAASACVSLASIWIAISSSSRASEEIAAMRAKMQALPTVSNGILTVNKLVVGTWKDGVTIGHDVLYVAINGKPRLALDATSDGPRFAVNDANGESRSVLGVNKTISKKTGTQTQTSEAALKLYDKSGTVVREFVPLDD